MISIFLRNSEIIGIEDSTNPANYSIELPRHQAGRVLNYLNREDYSRLISGYTINERNDREGRIKELVKYILKGE